MKRPPPALRWYRRLAALLPPTAREYAPEMLALVIRRRRALPATPVRVFWVRELLSLLTAVGRAWLDHVGTGLRGPVSATRITFELRILARGLVRAPIFTLSAVVTLAVGIGATSGVGSLAWRTLVAPLPFRDVDRLVQIYHDADLTAGISLAEMERYTRDAPTLAAVAAWNVGEITYQPVDGPAQRLPRAAVTPNIFEVLGRDPALGSGFPVDPPPGSVVVGHRFWRSHLAGAPDAVGRSIVLDGAPHTVVGVLPADVHVPDPQTELYLPLPPASSEQAGRTYVDVVARLAAGSSLQSASMEVDRVARSIPTAGSTSPTPGVRGGHARGLQEAWRGDSAPLVGAATLAAVLLLLATCVNVSLLVWSRRVRNAGDFQVRFAIGASRGDIARTQVVESILLGGLAAVLAVAVAKSVASALPRLAPELARSWTVVDAGVPLTVCVSAAAIAVVSLASLVGDVAERRLSPRRGLTARLLVPAQVAVAVVLVTGSVLLLRSVHAMLDVDLGYRVQDVVTGRLSLTGGPYETAEQQGRYFADIVDRVARVRGVEAAGVVNSLPLSPYGGSGSVTIQSIAADSAADIVAQRLVSPGYFRTLRIPLVAGRLFGPDDREGTERVAVIDETFARRFFASPQEALGARLRFFMGGSGWNEVVGVVGSVRPGGPESQAVPIVYVPFAQRPTRFAHLVVAGGPPDAVVNLIRAEVASLDPGVPLSDVRTMSERLWLTMARQRAGLAVFGAFAAVAMFLAALGTYAVSVLAEERRRREVGIRKALGAPPVRIAGLIASESLRPMGLGLTIGLVASLALGQALQTLLFEVPATDWPSLVLAVVLLATIVAAATAPSLIRALRPDGVDVLRSS